MTEIAPGSREPDRAPAPCIAGAPCFKAIVLLEPRLDIARNAAIICAIRTFKKIDVPGFQLLKPPASQTVSVKDISQLPIRQTQGFAGIPPISRLAAYTLPMTPPIA